MGKAMVKGTEKGLAKNDNPSLDDNKKGHADNNRHVLLLTRII